MGDTVRHGLELHQQGKLAEAERVYQDVLRERPTDFDAWYLLGAIALSTQRIPLAVERFSQAITLNPEHADAHNNLGAALAHSGRHTEALASFDKAIAVRPDHAGALINRGAALANLGHLEDALASYAAAIAARPDSAEAHSNHAAAQAALGRPEEALASCDRAIALHPDRDWAHVNRGNALRDLGRFEDALASYDAALALKPKHAGACNARGTVLANLGRLEAALASYDDAIASQPRYAEAFNNRGAALAELGRFDEAVADHDRAISLRPNHAGAFKNRGSALAAMGRLEEALSSCDRAIALRPDYAEAHANRAAALTTLGRIEVALLSCDNALALKPDLAEARYNQGACQLALGDFEHGWRGFEWRWKYRFGPVRPNLPGPPWDGETSIADRTILVCAEQGMGDTLQFCRYVPLLAKQAKVILDVPPPLRRLLADLDGVSDIIGETGAAPRIDTWIPMMSLPLAFRTTLATIPAAIPYLTAKSEQSAAWRRRLASLPGRKIGVVWAGSPFSQQPRAQAMDRRRSMALRDFAPLADVPGIALISLQKGDAASQARTPPAGMKLHDWTDELDDYADTAALIDALDLVISVDTSVVHLAGALGKPVWVLNRYDQCWRWLRDRADSPWYPTARLFRQRSPGDWAGVIDDVMRALRSA
jgi:tetratricopeptide (TPR) repeat protein